MPYFIIVYINPPITEHRPYKVTCLVSTRELNNVDVSTSRWTMIADVPQVMKLQDQNHLPKTEGLMGKKKLVTSQDPVHALSTSVLVGMNPLVYFVPWLSMFKVRLVAAASVPGML